MRKTHLLGGAFGVSLLLVGLAASGVLPRNQPDPIEVPGIVCQTAEDRVVHFFAYDTPGVEFGPAVEQREAEAVMQEQLARELHDPALVVAAVEYSRRDYSSPEERDRKVAYLAQNAEAHCEAVLQLWARRAVATKIEVKQITTDNRSMWMLDTRPRPTIVEGPSNVTTFDALVYTYADGTRDVYKLDCGFQPMAPEFPGIPSLPPDEVPPPTSPPVTQPPATSPPTSPPTTTTVVKDHTQSPVSDDPDDPIEVVRPNVPAPPVVIRPTVPAGQTTTTQALPPVTVPAPPEVQAPQPATPGPAPANPAPPDPEDIVADWGEDGIPPG